MLRLHRYVLFDELRGRKQDSLRRGYRAEDRRPVLARVLEHEHPSPAELARLRHEYAVETELGLPGVVEPVELVPHGRGLALVWTDPGATPLTTLLDAGPLPLELGLRIAANIARTLASVHARGVVHKNLNPESVLVDPETATAYLLGFGIASRLSQEFPRPTSVDALEGALAYVSPEQTGRMNRLVDRRSDLYSLGVLLYHFVVGQVPFATTDTMELIYAHLVRRPQPPIERVAELPPIVSKLILRLLAKNAEDRYQYALSVADDLDACVAALTEGRPLDDFPLARGDHERGDPFAIPQRLYGREVELDALHAAWRRIATGAAELLVVRGYSGIGKSVLVHEIHKELTGARGYFVSGKFDQLARGGPYAPLTIAAGELVHLLLTESGEELEGFAAQLLAAIGDDAGVLTAMIPELERIIGPQAPPIDLGGSAAQRRLEALFAHFLRACTRSGRPVVVFLDDLQWADLASLALLEALLERLDDCPLLWIGAYRSNEVDADHPLSASLETIAERSTLSAIDLGPLARGDVQRFIADTLATSVDEVDSLARLAYAKTEGNPFFLIQLLVAIHEDGLLRWSPEHRRYRWDAQALAATAAADNVVSFMAERLERLPATTREVLELAACIGFRFSLSTLARVSERSPQELAAALWPGLERGVIVPLDPSYQLPRETEPPAEVQLRFLHDRVQQAAYAGADAEQRPALHLRIGRLLEASEAEHDRFDLVSHLNLGRELIDDPAERLGLASLNLDTGRHARAAAAYDAAAQLFAIGIELLGPQGFTEHGPLTRSLHLAAAEVGILAADHERAERTIEALLAEDASNHERARVLDLRAVLAVAQGRPAAAVGAGVEALTLLGFEVPETSDAREQAYARLLAAISTRISARTIAELAAAPELDDPKQRLALLLARHTALSAFGTATALGYWLTALAVWLSLEHGHSDQSSSAYALLGAVLASSTTRFTEAHALVKLALAVHERRGDGVHEACMLGFYFTTVSHYAMSWRELLPYLERARLAGLEAGDHLFHSYTCSHQSIVRLILGDPLDEVRPEVERALAKMQTHKLASAEATQTVVRQTIACLEGRSEGPTSLSDGRVDEDALVERMVEANMSFALYWYRTTKGALLLLAGDRAAAFAMLEPLTRMIPIAFTPEARWFTALALLGLEPEAREEHATLIERCRSDCAIWAEASPANYAHRHLLVEAEAAASEGALEQAMARYDDALAVASAHDWPRDRAIISELAARFYLARGRSRIARAYMTDACYDYAAWGAAGHVAQLAKRFPDLVPIEASLDAHRAQTRDEAADAIDMHAFALSLQTIAREVELDSVVEQTMRLVLHSAGAERAVLLLEREAGLEVYAKVAAEPPALRLSPGLQLDEDPELPAQIIRYVARLVEPLVVDDAARDPRFASDPFVARVRPRSIACLPMTQQGRSRGLLYLENNATAGAFTERRLELLRLLSSQAMISVDNAELYARIQSVREELAATNAKLAGQVDSQTEKLREINERLRAELTKRERTQAQRLAELSTPVIPLSREILIMPLIGTLDEARALDIREQALDSAHQRRARVVIFDLTGVKGGDVAIANALLATARALRLIGAEVIVTGIRPTMALVLLDTGSDIARLRTAATLEDGIATATTLLGD